MIGALLRGDVAHRVIVGTLLVKSIIWSTSLGSGTSGGVLAPLLLIGGALGGVETSFLPDAGVGFWPLVNMGAILGGTMRAPFTGVVFALELTHDVNMLLPLLIAVTVAHCFTVLALRRSILTEKIARRGFHLSREYATDPLEILFAREVMRANVVALRADSSPENLASLLNASAKRRQRLYPVVDAEGLLVGVVRARNLLESGDATRLADVVEPDPVVAHPDEPLRVLAYRMAETGLTQLPVVERGTKRRVVGWSRWLIYFRRG